MPSINGITATIETHDGPLPEFGCSEFRGGKGCYIPAQSGQQFWLHYTIHKPIPCKAASVEFYVDGQRVDAQFPLPRKNTDNSTVGPIDSTIKSQYGRDINADGVEVAWRREIFFALIKPVKATKPRCKVKRTPTSAEAEQYGTIDCKIFRSEKSPEWAGAVTPEEFRSLSDATKTLKSRPLSHVSRLGVKMATSTSKRYCVKSLDPDDAPFAWFKFYYRSRQRLIEKFGLEQLRGLSLQGEEGEPVSQSPTNATPNVPSQTPSQASSQTPPRMQALPHDLGVSPDGGADNIDRETGLEHSVTEANKGADLLDTFIEKLEEELALAEKGGSVENDKIAACHEKISRLRQNSEKLRLRAVEIQKKADLAKHSSLANHAEDTSVSGEDTGSEEDDDGN
jgi:hypothetical protein